MSPLGEPVDATDAIIPRPAATLMLVRDGDDGPHGALEVLLLRRSSATPFVPGAHVFPGGAVEPDDGTALDDLVDGLDHETAEAILDVPGALAWWVAAIRECVEEAGVVLATDDDGPIDPGHRALADLTRVRADLEAGRLRLADWYRDHGLRLPLGEVAYVSRWITPAWSPRRYDARFFVAAMPPGQDAGADGWEAVDARWWKPPEALADWQAGRIELIEPTVASLQQLAASTSAADALAALRDAPPGGQDPRGPGRGIPTPGPEGTRP